MKLITKQIEKQFAKIGSQDGIPDPIVVAKFFTPSGSATWHATEYNSKDRICYGYVTGLQYDEWGYFSIDELEAIKCPPFGLPIERDLHCGELPISFHRPELLKEIMRKEELLRKRKQEKSKDKNQELER